MKTTTVNEGFAGEATYTYTVEDNDGTQLQANVFVRVTETAPPITSSKVVFEAEAYTWNSAGGVTNTDSEAIEFDGADLPYGMFSFKVAGLPANEANPASVYVSFYFAEALPENSRWFKYNEVTGIMAEYQEEVTFNGHYVNIKLTDGGSGDADGVVDGVIVDPSGPQVPGTPLGEESVRGNESGSGGGGQLSLLLVGLLMIRPLVLRRKVVFLNGEGFKLIKANLKMPLLAQMDY